MNQLTQSEVNSIREIASAHLTTAVKLNTFAGQCSDNKIKQMFSTASTQAQKGAQDLISML